MIWWRGRKYILMYKALGPGVAIKLVDYIEQREGIDQLDSMAEQLWAIREKLVDR